MTKIKGVKNWYCSLEMKETFGMRPLHFVTAPLPPWPTGTRHDIGGEITRGV